MFVIFSSSAREDDNTAWVKVSILFSCNLSAVNIWSRTVLLGISFSPMGNTSDVLNVCEKEIDLLLCTLGDEFLTFDYLHSETLLAVVDAFAA